MCMCAKECALVQEGNERACLRTAKGSLCYKWEAMLREGLNLLEVIKLWCRRAKRCAAGPRAG